LPKHFAQKNKNSLMGLEGEMFVTDNKTDNIAR